MYINLPDNERCLITYTITNKTVSLDLIVGVKQHHTTDRSGWRLRLERPPLASAIHIWRAYYYSWTNSQFFCQEHDFRTVRLLNQNIRCLNIGICVVGEGRSKGEEEVSCMMRDGCRLECCKEFVSCKLEEFYW